MSECDLDPPCYYSSKSGLYAVDGNQARPSGFEPSESRALALDGDTLIASGDGAVFALSDDRWRKIADIDHVRDFFRLPIGQFAVSGSEPVPPFAGYPYSGGVTRISGLNGDYNKEYLYLFGAVSSSQNSNRIFIAENRVAEEGIFIVPVEAPYPTLSLEYDDLGAVEAVDGLTVYAGAIDSLWFDGFRPPPSRIFRSDDAGDTWTPDDAGMTARNVYAFAAIGSGPARLDAAGTSGGVFVRAPGAPWQADGLADRTVFTLYTAPAGLLAGTDDGLFLRGASGWTRYGDGLDGRSVYAILTKTDAAGEWTGVGTDRGLFQTRAFVVGAQAPPVVEARLAVTTLPNPGRGVRTVRLDGLTKAATVVVLDLLGRTVADLGRHEPASGRLELRWDASALPAGVYVVRVRSGADVVAARAVVTR